jgi:hypothetical protein
MARRWPIFAALVLLAVLTYNCAAMGDGLL